MASSKRIDIVLKTRDNPSPSAYNLPSDISPKKGSKGYTFGLPWSTYNKVFLEHDKPANPINPGPGTYKFKENIGKEGKKYTCQTKASFIESQYLVKVPGPGAYSVPSCINEKGRYFYSPFRDSGVRKFSPLSHGNHNKSIIETVLKCPGPTTYDTLGIMNFNHSGLSSFKNIGKIPMPKEDRKLFARPKFSISNSVTPGPGSYSKTTEFGFQKKLEPIERAVQKQIEPKILPKI